MTPSPLLRQMPRLTVLVMAVPVLAGLWGTLGPALDGGFARLSAWPGLSRAMGLSLLTGFVATGLSLGLTLGIVAALHGTSGFRWVERLLAPVLSLPHAAAALGLAFLIAPSGWIARAGHPLQQRGALTLEDLLDYPIATTPLSDEVVRRLVGQFGPRAHPSQLTTLQCDDVGGLLAVVERTDAIFLGVKATARERIEAGALALLPVAPAIEARASFAYVTLAGRSEAPVMAILREFVAQRMVD